MKIAARFGCVGVLVAMMPLFASGQMGMHVAPAMRGIFNPVVGSGGEYEMTTDKGTKMVMESLTVVDGTDTVVSRMIMQMGTRPPMEMPTQMNKSSAQKQPADIRDRADDVGSETVTTPAGTFTAEHYKMKDGSGDAWVAPKAGPYGLVKFQG